MLSDIYGIPGDNFFCHKNPLKVNTSLQKNKKQSDRKCSGSMEPEQEIYMGEMLVTYASPFSGW